MFYTQRSSWPSLPKKIRLQLLSRKAIWRSQGKVHFCRPQRWVSWQAVDMSAWVCWNYCKSIDFSRPAFREGNFFSKASGFFFNDRGWWTHVGYMLLIKCWILNENESFCCPYQSCVALQSEDLTIFRKRGLNKNLDKYFTCFRREL